MPLWPLAYYAVAILAVVAVMLLGSHLLGERHRERATGEVYESGVPHTGSARRPYNAQFYLVAMLFVLFDVEVIFLLAWALVARDAGWRGLALAAGFAGLLLLTLAYAVRQGALDMTKGRAP